MCNLSPVGGMNMQIDNVKVVCEDWRELNRLTLFGIFCLVFSNISCPTLHSHVSSKSYQGINKQIDNVKDVCEDWRKLNRLALFGALCLLFSNILYPLN